MNCFTSYKGGLKINTKAQAIDHYGNLVPGLYAAGEGAGGLFSDGKYLCGTMISMSLTFGRIAGRNAAAETP
jgi:fumarate reductase flavoprotein subunit